MKFENHCSYTNTIQSNLGESDSDAAPPSSKSRKTTTAFSDVVAGKAQEEICRYFLSSLMLANTYNIELTFNSDSGAAPQVACEFGETTGCPRKRDRREQQPGMDWSHQSRFWIHLLARPDSLLE